MARTKKPAAAKKPATAKADEPASKRKLGEWLGYSTCSVLKALGKAGASVAHARAIAAEAGVKAKDATVQLNVSAGRRGDGKIAPLTAAQVKELLASAPEPEAEGEAK